MAEGIQRDPDVWLEDGNLVIVANSITAFRLYKGLLGQVSAIFRDAFEFAAPDPGETIDDCPVVRLADSPVEMGHFLRAVFRPSTSISSQDTLPFATVASVIRIAHKYEAQEIVDAACGRLESFLIPGPGHWMDSAALSWQERWTLGQSQCGVAFDVQDAIEAVALAHLVDRPRMLPVALYLCCLLSAAQLRNGVSLSRAGGGGAVERLSDDDFARCVSALPVLAKECHANVLRALDIGTPACADCKRKKKWRIALRQYEREAREDRACALLDMLVRVDRRAVLPTTWKPESLCARCLQEWSRRSADECVRTRRKLPEMFGLKELQQSGWERTYVPPNPVLLVVG